MAAVNQDTIIYRLLADGVIIKDPLRRGHYTVRGEDEDVRRIDIVSRFCQEVAPGRYYILEDKVQEVLGRRIARPLRYLAIDSYGDSNHGDQNYWVRQALLSIPNDADGIRRSFGLEFEIYELPTEQDTSDLAYLLDELPAHTCNHDGSLSSSGVEVVFAPMSADDYIRTVKTLRQFVEDHGIEMQDGDYGAGMHTTYGVSNTESTKEDMQIRLSRIGLMIKASMTRRQIIDKFGRDFGNYRLLPNANLSNFSHSLALSMNGRPNCCWEFRLPNYKADPEFLVNFFKVTEWIFHRPATGKDMYNLFNLLTDGQMEAGA